ncbi:hypothetical protein V6N11_033335 [Hibiscus sabdariffa]|uniref:Uncharacterized protein n=1 Tax=Hibiscus sabdariffa TaxID=183260 RepID=A0ABR2PXQ4_9ROSI
MVVKSIKDKSGSFFLYLCSKGFQNSESSTKGNALSVSVSDQKKPGGWKAMPFILGNETFERFATIGLLSNFMVYLMREFNMDQVSASNVLFIWSGVTNFAPLVGAFISDAYVGRFLTIAVCSVASFLGMLTITLTAWIPDLQPPRCQPEQQLIGHCISASKAQIGVLECGVYYDPPLKDYVLSKLPLTYQFRSLNKAAITTENDIEPDVMSAFNFVYFLYVARRYRYKGQVQIESKSSEPDVELSSMKA